MFVRRVYVDGESVCWRGGCMLMGRVYVGEEGVC